MKDDDAFLLSRKCRVKQLGRKETAGIRQHEKGEAELASLRLVNGQGVR